MSRYIISEKCIVHRKGKIITVVSVENLEVYSLNETASLILGYFERGYTIENIKEKFATNYNVSAIELKSSLTEVKEFLLAKKILVKST